MGVSPLQGVSASGKSPYPRDFANGVVQGSLAASGASTLGPTKPFAFYGTLNLFIWCEYVTTLTTTNGSLGATLGTAGLIAAGASVNGANVPHGTVMQDTTHILLPTYTYFANSKTGIAQLTGIYDTSKLLGATVNGLGVAGATVSTIDTPSVIVAGASNNNIPGKLTLSAVTTDGPADDQPTPFEFSLAASGSVTTGADAAAIFTGAAIGLTGTVQLERSFDGGRTWVLCNIGSSGALAQWSLVSPISVAFGEPERDILYRLNVVALTGATGITPKYRMSATGQQATTLSVQTL